MKFINVYVWICLLLLCTSIAPVKNRSPINSTKNHLDIERTHVIEKRNEIKPRILEEEDDEDEDDDEDDEECNCEEEDNDEENEIIDYEEEPQTKPKEKENERITEPIIKDENNEGIERLINKLKEEGYHMPRYAYSAKHVMQGSLSSSNWVDQQKKDKRLSGPLNDTKYTVVKPISAKWREEEIKTFKKSPVIKSKSSKRPSLLKK